MELQRYVRTLARRWPVLLAAVLVGLLFAGGYALSATPLYSSTAEVIVVTEGGDSANELAQSSDYSQSQVRSFSAVATRPVVLDPVIESLGLDTSATDLAKDISVSSPLNTSLISISATAPGQQEAADLANAVASELSAFVSRISPVTDSGNSRVRLEPIQAAVPAEVPSSPNTPALLVLGLVGGLVAGVLIVAGVEALDTKVRSAESAREVIPVPVVGSFAVESKMKERGILRGPDDLSARAESVRQLRTNIQFLGAVSAMPRLAITSSVPGEGKSTTAANLAISLAAAGQRVCLVDADWRRPTIDKYLGLEGSVGLSTVLAGDSSLDEAIQQWGRPPVDVLTAGVRPPNPAELLASPGMARVMAELDERYDTVVYDCAPLLPVTDGAVVAQACGGAILMVAEGMVRKGELEKAASILETLDTPVSGLVMNYASHGTVGSYSYRYGSLSS